MRLDEVTTGRSQILNFYINIINLINITIGTECMHGVNSVSYCGKVE